MKKAAAIVVVLVLAVAPPAGAGKLAPDTKGYQKIELKHFLLMAQREVSEKDLLEIRRNLKNVRREVGKDFGGAYPDYKFIVYLTDEAAFHKYSYTPKHVMGLFNGDIHLPVPSILKDERVLKSVLWHEYTHAVVWYYSKDRCPVWLHEAFAVYEEEKILPMWKKRYEEFFGQEEGSALRPIKDLAGMFARQGRFSSQDIGRMYGEAYAYADYLKARYSRASIRKFIEMIGQTQSVESALKGALSLSLEKLHDRAAERIKDQLS